MSGVVGIPQRNCCVLVLIGDAEKHRIARVEERFPEDVKCRALDRAPPPGACHSSAKQQHQRSSSPHVFPAARRIVGWACRVAGRKHFR